MVHRAEGCRWRAAIAAPRPPDVPAGRAPVGWRRREGARSSGRGDAAGRSGREVDRTRADGTA